MKMTSREQQEQQLLHPNNGVHLINSGLEQELTIPTIENGFNLESVESRNVDAIPLLEQTGITLPITALRLTREVIERRAMERARNWSTNLSNVIQEIRPLVQQAHSVNNSIGINSWMPSRDSGFHYLPLNNFDENHQHNHNNDVHNQVQQHSTNDFVINLDETPQYFPTSQVVQTHPTPPSILRPHDNNIRGGHEDTLPLQNEINNQPINLNANERHQQPEQPNSGPHVHHHHHHHHNNNNNINNNNNNNNENDDGSVTAAFAQLPETRALLNSLRGYTPFICIILAKSCYDHLDGILDFFALFITFSHSNWIVRQEIAKQNQKRVLLLLRELLYIILVISIIGFMIEKNNIFISIIYGQTFSNPFTLRNLLFSLGITDFILKLITVGIKIIITLLPPNIVEYKGRGRIYLMTESISQLYRSLAPIQPWLVYLLDSYTGSEKLMGVLLSAAYTVAKFSEILKRAKFCQKSFIKLFQKVSFGVTPTKEQINVAGNQCPICHDAFFSPIMLDCNHIFCELCVGTWFDREQTCPLCRAKVVDDPIWRDGETTFFTQFY